MEELRPPKIDECEPEDFRETCNKEEEKLCQDIESWLEADKDDPGYHIMTEK